MVFPSHCWSLETFSNSKAAATSKVCNLDSIVDPRCRRVINEPDFYSVTRGLPDTKSAADNRVIGELTFRYGPFKPATFKLFHCFLEHRFINLCIT